MDAIGDGVIVRSVDGSMFQAGNGERCRSNTTLDVVHTTSCAEKDDHSNDMNKQLQEKLRRLCFINSEPPFYCEVNTTHGEIVE
jgi:hypothetical protein